MNLLSDKTTRALYSSMLNVQGRILFDFFVVAQEDGSFLLDCDPELGSEVIKHLQRYKLRSKVEIIDVSKEFRVWSTFGKNIQNVKGELFFTDPRVHLLGKRAIYPINKPQRSNILFPLKAQ